MSYEWACQVSCDTKHHTQSKRESLEQTCSPKSMQHASMLAMNVPSGNQRHPGSLPCSATSFQRSVAPKGASRMANHCCRRAACGGRESTMASTIQRAVERSSSSRTAMFVCRIEVFLRMLSSRKKASFQEIGQEGSLLGARV